MMKPMQVALAVAGLTGLAVTAPAAAKHERGNVSAKRATLAAPAGVSAEQRAMLDEKLELIRQIMQAAEPDMQASGFTSEGRRSMLENLFSMSLSEVRAVGLPGSAIGAANAIVSAKAAAKRDGQPKLGQLATELVYLPFVPCRYIDTRFPAPNPISDTRQFDLDASGSSYGGSGACNPMTLSGIGAGFSFNGAALAFNAAIFAPTVAPGFMGARPVGTTSTTSFVNWYESGPSVQASNWGVASYDQGSTTLDEIEFFGGPAHLIVDVFGVFAAPTATRLQCVEVFNPAASTVNPESSEFLLDEEIKACPAGYTSVGYIWDYASGTGGLAPWGNSRTVAPGSPSDVAGLGFTHVRASDAQAGSAISFYPGRTCCRLPGR